MEPPKLFVVITLILFSTACSKSQNESLKIERSEELVGKKWQLISSTQSWKNISGEVEVYDLLSTIAEHARDNYIVLEADNSFRVYDNVLLNPAGPPSGLAGSWRISENGQLLTFDYVLVGMENFTWSIKSVSESQLELYRLENTVTFANTYFAIQ